jgi:hypothetical protein
MKCGFCNDRGIQALGRQKYIDENLVPLQLDHIGSKKQKSNSLVIHF